MPRLPDLLIFIGGLVSVAGALRGNLAYFRYFRSKRLQETDRKARAIASLEFVYEGAAAGVIVGVGLEILVTGLAFGGDINANSLILVPAALTLGAAYAAWWTRRFIARLRRSP